MPKITNYQEECNKISQIEVITHVVKMLKNLGSVGKDTQEVKFSSNNG